MFWGYEAKDKGARAAATPEVVSSLKKRFTPRLRYIIALLAAPAILTLSTPAALAAQSGCPMDGHSPGTSVTTKQIVIIIDDLGYNLSRGRQVVALPGNITYAVIPFTPFGKQLAQAAHNAGKEVMLHAPMSTLDFAPLGSGGLTPDQSRQEFHDAVYAALEDIPYVQGVNNHMGSDLTARRQQMAWLMRELRWQGLYFVDSRTNDATVAATVAGEFSVPHLSRHVFLDNEANTEAIAKRFNVLLEKAQRDGLAVGIGHPHPATIAFLQETLPTLPELGVELKLVSEALAGELKLKGEQLATAGTGLTENESVATCCPAC